MKIDAPLNEQNLSAVRAAGTRLEALGFDGAWTFETNTDPFLPLLEIALGTEHLKLGTNIAIAFARTPFSMAMTAWDLQRVSQGRLMLGLGTQVRAHIERRFSAEFDHPAARVTDYIHCLRAIWYTFQTGARPDYRGRFYRFSLINDFFNPGPIEHPDIQVYLAGVNPRMARAAGDAADGFNVHPMHSPAYLRDVVRPAIDEGARSRGKTVDDLELVADCFVIRGATEAERSKSEQSVRQQVAFYASTPSYRTFLEYHDLGDIGKPLSAAMRERDFATMSNLIPDSLLDAVAVSEADGEVARLLRQRYAGDLVQRLTLYEPPGDNDASVRELLGRLRG